MKKRLSTLSIGWIAGIGSLCLALLFATLANLSLQDRQHSWQAQLEQQHQLQSLALDSNFSELQQEAALLAEMTAVKERLQRALQQAVQLQQQGVAFDAPPMAALRREIQETLKPSWKALQEHAAAHLYVHLGQDMRVFLRLHNPADFGDSQAGKRPWVSDTLQDGKPRSGLGTGRESVGLRAAMAILDPDSQQPLGAVEISFSSLPQIVRLDRRLDAGIALLINRTQLARQIGADKLARFQGPHNQEWQIIEQSRPQAGHWLLQGKLPQQLTQRQMSIIEDAGRTYLLSLLPLAAYASGSEAAAEPLAGALVWRDISALNRSQQAGTDANLLKWALAWLVAEGVLLALLYSTRRSALQQAERHRQALLVKHRQSETTHKLLDIIAQAQAGFINEQNQRQTFDALLERILQLTESQFGFVGEVLHNSDSQPYLRTFAISNIAWDQASRDFYANHAPAGMEFRNLKSLFGEVLRSGELLISNAPAQDPRSGGLPPGHPPLLAFIGLPILFGGQLVGMLGMANRPGGYSEELAAELQPLLATLGQLIEALRRDAQKRSSQQLAERQQLALRALNEVAALPNLSRHEQLRQALQIGVEFFDMPTAAVGQFNGERYQVLAQARGSEPFHEGEELPLSETYCQFLLQGQSVLAIEQMQHSAYAEQPCYARHGLESYIGSLIWIDGQPFGALSFASHLARPQPFDSAELEFIRLLARWIGALLERHSQERRRQELLQSLQLIASQVPGAIFEYQIHPDGRRYFPYVSEGIHEIYGASPGQLREDTNLLRESVHPEDRERFIDSLQRSRDELHVWHSEHRVQHPRKGLIWVEGHAAPKRMEDGSTRWYGFFADITERKRVEAQLNETRTFLQTVVDASTEVALITTDTQGVITLFNTGAERLLGYSAGELIGRQSPALFHLNEEVERRGQALSAELGRPIRGFEVFVARARNGQADTRQWTYLRKDGSERFVNLTITSIRAPSGEIQGFLGIATDITELTAATRELQASEQRFRSLVGSLPGVVYRCSLDDDGSMLYLSDEIERLTAFPSGDFVDNRVRSYSSLIHPDDRERVRQTRQQQIDNKSIFELTYRLQHADGHWLWVRDNGRADYDNQGRALWLNGFVWDISEQRQAELELATNERLYSTLFETVPIGITLIREADGQILDCNPAVERMTGFSREQLRRRNRRDFVNKIDLDYSKQLAQLAATGTYGPLERRIQIKDGSFLEVLINGARIEIEQGEPLLWSVMQDISERVRNERMKDEFISTVSHELRTPLTSISGAIGLIVGGALGSLPENMQQMLQIAYQNSQRLGLLINDLLDMDKLVAGQMHFQLSLQPLIPMLEQALESNQSYAEQYGVHWRRGEMAADAWVKVDPQRLQQVLSNLLSNAAKFSPRGGSVEVRIERRDHHLRVCVEDHGQGIPPAFHGKIFQKFAQADASDTRQKGGTGLGLAISKELIERMGGQIGFDSTPGQGTTFWFELPAMEPA